MCGRRKNTGEVGEVVELRTPQGLRDAPRAERIAAAARAAMGGWHLLFVHADGDRDTEAWALTDGDALREVFGTTASDEALGLLRSPQAVENIPDPKQKLEEVCRTAQGGRKGRRRRKSVALLEAIGERVSLDALGDVPAFQNLQSDLREALSSLGYLA